ncbi:MAG TPA: NAD-dependent epimerase/dehydratase family protein [Vicinamibacterales bacterium]|nr:NAD-dependent epimerase/dehydratase family protein [Vicinamibacterales bacterium]
MARVAVTGASGFIGQHLVAALESRGDSVIRVARPFLRGTLAPTFAQTDAVVHLAGVVSAAREQDYFDANEAGTRIVGEAARDAKVRMIYVSSLAAAGPAAPDAPRGEDDPESPINAYGRSKLAGERALKATDGLRWTILRPGVVYGPGDRALLPLFRLSRRGFLPLVGRPSAAYTFIHVADVVRAIAAAIDCDVTGETIFLGHRNPVATRALLESIRTATGGRAAILPIPQPLLRVVAWGGDVAGAISGRRALINSRRYVELYADGFVCRVDRLRDRLHAEAQVALGEGLTQTARWYESQRWV